MPIEAGKIRNVAVVGHRGTGKTSLVEALLFQAGKTNRLGTIDRSPPFTNAAPSSATAIGSGCTSAANARSETVNVHDAARSTLFSARERVALRFAELMAVDHLKIDDALFAELRGHFTEAEIVEIGVSIGLFLGPGRFNAVLGIDPV